MTHIVASDLPYDWHQDIVPHLDTLESVNGGFTPAKRGIITLQDGAKMFVKIATGPLTEAWLKKEIKVYKILNAAGYQFIPQLLAHSEDQDAMAITYLKGARFDDYWDADKLTAILRAQESLKTYKHLFVNDPDFISTDTEDIDTKWQVLLMLGNIDTLNQKLTKLGGEITVDRSQIEAFARQQAGWQLRQDTLIHEDIRADNFGYDPKTKIGLLIDWNWLCIGDESLDATPLFIKMHLHGFEAYKFHPEKYDAYMLRYLVSFWAESILNGDEDSSPREWKMRAAQAKNLAMCCKLLTEKF